MLGAFVVAVIIVAPDHLITDRVALWSAAALAGLLTLWAWVLPRVRIMWARAHLRTAAGILLLADVMWLTLFVYGTGGFRSPFEGLLLLVILFAAAFFGGLPTALPSVAWVVALIHVCFVTSANGEAASAWHVSGRLMSIFAVAWLAYGLSWVLERERRANDSVVRNLTEGILLIDGDQTIALANPRIAKLCGLPNELLVGEVIRDIPRKPVYEPLLAMVADVGKTQGDTLLRRDITLTLPEHVDLRITTIPCVMSDTLVVGWVVICHDITDSKTADRMRDEGMAVLSHELRSPLSTLRAVAHVLSTLTENLDSEERATYVDAIDRETDRLVNLVTRLLDVTTLEQGPSTLELESVQIEKLIAKVADVFRVKARLQGIAVRTGFGAWLPDITADAGRLEQVLVNLCQNALKYTPAGGTIKLSAISKGDEIQIAVSDSGCGISPEQLEAIFDKFSQADEGADVPLMERGMGLGLYIARTIVQLHGGEISVDSTIGEGTTFYVILPVVPLKLPPGIHPRTHHPASSYAQVS